MGKQPELIELEQECLHVTDNAILVVTDFNKKEWIPRSVIIKFIVNRQISPWSVTFTVPYWLAHKKGLI